MHGQRFLIHELHYGSDGVWLYIRIDFAQASEEALRGAELRFQFHETEVTVPLAPSFETGARDGLRIQAAFGHIFEMRIAERAIGKAHPIKFQVSVWKAGLPLDALPQQGALELQGHELNEWFG